MSIFLGNDMPYKHYDWANSRSPPILQPHSLIKHEIIEAYIEKYVSSSMAVSYSNNLKITIIDGFSGGGTYRIKGSKKIYFGSPFIFLKTIQKIEKEIEAKTGKGCDNSTYAACGVVTGFG